MSHDQKTDAEIVRLLFEYKEQFLKTSQEINNICDILRRRALVLSNENFAKKSLLISVSNHWRRNASLIHTVARSRAQEKMLLSEIETQETPKKVIKIIKPKQEEEEITSWFEGEDSLWQNLKNLQTAKQEKLRSPTYTYK